MFQSSSTPLNNSRFQQGGFQQGGLQGGYQGGFQKGGLQQGKLLQQGGLQQGVYQGGLTQGGLIQPASTLQQPTTVVVNPRLRSTYNIHTAPGTHAKGNLFGTQNQQPQQHSTTAYTQQSFAQPQQQQPVVYPQQQQQFQQQWVQQIPIESVVRPTIVEQTQRAERVVEIQPIIHRQIDAPEVHIIEQHIYERVSATAPPLVTRPTIVQEVVTPRIIEEVQPIIHREVPETFVERVEQHVTEHVVQPATTTKQVINEQPRFMPAGGPIQQQFGQQQSGQFGQQGQQQYQQNSGLRI